MLRLFCNAYYCLNLYRLAWVFEIYESLQIGAESNPGEQVDRRLCNIAVFGAAALVEGAPRRRKPTDFPEMPDVVPDFGLPSVGITIRPGIETPAQNDSTGREPAAATLEGVPSLDASSSSSGKEVGATLRAEPQPKLVEISSVKVETSSLFAHLYEDGRVIIDYHDDD